MWQRNAVLLVVLTSSLAGCASVSSVPEPEHAQGLTYYLPKKDFVITLTVSDKARTVTAETTPAYPDRQHRYAVRFQRNWLGKNEMDVDITPSGLLTSAYSKTTSNVSEVLQNLAAAKSVSVLGSDKAAADECAKPGVYSKIVSAQATPTPIVDFCSLRIEVKALSVEESANKPKADGGKAGAARSGFYYRNALPYLLTVTSQLDSRSFLLFSPSESLTQFLPVKESWIASNEATLTFDEGMPTKYKQAADGELVALTKLPADILSAYFAAIGNAFGSRKAAAISETEYLKALQGAELQRLKLQQCQQAIPTGDPVAIQAACED